jgi:hypothetical protein
MSDITNAQDFYGSAFTTARADNLNKACKYLDMAIRADTDTKREMALTAALKAEAAAFVPAA